MTSAASSHPGIILDQSEPRVEGGPRALPLVYGRMLYFCQGGGLSLFSGTYQMTLDIDVDGARLYLARGPEHVSFDTEFRVRRHAFRLVRGDELIVDARVVGAGKARAVVFNCFHALDGDVRWRGFDPSDPERTPLDVLIGKGGAVRYAPSSAGMPLELVVENTESQKARMDPAGAAQLVKPLLVAALDDRTWLTALDVTATWDGASVPTVRSIKRRNTEEPVSHAVARALTTFWRLIGREPPDAIEERHVTELRTLFAAPAPPEALAEIVRALFPDAWAVERAVREQAAMLDPDIVGQMR